MKKILISTLVAASILSIGAPAFAQNSVPAARAYATQQSAQDAARQRLFDQREHDFYTSNR